LARFAKPASALVFTSALPNPLAQPARCSIRDIAILHVNALGGYQAVASLLETSSSAPSRYMEALMPI
jgi:hypothetical protein